MTEHSIQLEAHRPITKGLFSTSANVALHGVYEISKILAVPARLEMTLANVMALLSSFLEMRHGLIVLFDDLGGTEIVTGPGWQEANAKNYFDALPERAIGQIYTTRLPLVVEDVRSHVLFREWATSEWADSEHPISFIGVPIKDRDKIIGAITIDRVIEGPERYSADEDVRFLVMIANLIGQTVRLQKVVLRDRERLMAEQARLSKELSEKTERNDRKPRGAAMNGIVGESPTIKAVYDKIAIVARTNSTVLLRGESGTGKELFARAAHDLSPRKAGPFVKLNCAALSESVLESELFGHEKGAFTGAVALRKGRFELADGGTLFLDEIGEISASFQAKLLRVLQEGEFERVGGSKTLKVNVRLVAATNRNLEEAVQAGTFRADLYYRINVVNIALPPLRERPGDVILLAKEFLRRYNDEHAAQINLGHSARRVLESCFFPGNVRELENCIRRTATLSHSEEEIVAEDFACSKDECLSSLIWRGGTTPPRAANIAPQARGDSAPPPTPYRRSLASPAPAVSAPVAGHPEDDDCDPALAINCPDSDKCGVLNGDGATERERLIDAMETAGWVQAKAARILNLTPRQIGYALRKHGISIKKF